MKLLHILLLGASLSIGGCGRSGTSSNADPDDAIKGWNCLFSAHDNINPLDNITSNAPLAYANFCEQHKAVLDDAQGYIKQEETAHTPTSPPHTFLDIFANVQGAAVYESGLGRYAIRYDVYIKDSSSDWDCVYLLLYDKENKRTKVIFVKHPHPARGFGKIKPGVLLEHKDVAWHQSRRS